MIAVGLVRVELEVSFNGIHYSKICQFTSLLKQMIKHLLPFGNNHFEDLCFSCGRRLHL